MGGIPEHLASWEDLLIFDFEGTGDETLFRNMRDPNPRSKRVLVKHNATDAKPFRWTANPDRIINTVRRGHQMLAWISHIDNDFTAF